jgi:soluble lytic murein transglycosylase-like protein
MARIAIIALMLFAAALARAQQPDTAVPAAPAPTVPPAQTDPSKNTPHPNPLPQGERERTVTPAAPPSAATDAPPSVATTPAPPADSNSTTPPAAADAPPASVAPPAPSTTTEAPPAAAPTPPPARAGNVDVRESLCLMIESAARAQNLPLEFFARVIWQESRFQADVVGPRTRSGDRAQGIAQFMPRTAAERGLLDPFDPVQALPKSAEFLRELADQFGNLGLAAAAYNAGPGRLREFLSGRRPLPAETRHYVLAITGISVDEWAGSGKREPLHVPKAGCGELMALLHRAPNPFVQKLEERVNVVAAAPWGVQLAAGFSRDHALANYATLARRYADLLVGRDPSLLSSILRSRGTQPFYQVRVGADTRAAAETLCGSIRRAGGACFVLRNRAG